MYSIGTWSWNRSLIEFTKMRWGFFHRSGRSNVFGCVVSLKPFIYLRWPIALSRYDIRSA